MKINPKREKLTKPDTAEEWDYLTIYDGDDQILAQSENHHFESTIILEYDGVCYMCGPDGRIWLDYETLKNKFK